MRKGKKRVIVLSVILGVMIVAITGCFLPKGKATNLYRLAIRDTESRMIPYADVRVKDETGKVVYRGKSDENGTIQFRRVEKRVKIEIESAYLGYTGEVGYRKDGGVEAITLKEEKEEKGGGITWRNVEGKLTPYLFLPKAAGIVILTAQEEGAGIAEEVEEGKLIRLPREREEEGNTYIWFSLEKKEEPTLIEAWGLKERWEYGDDPITYIEAREVGGAVLFVRGEARGTGEERGHIPNGELTKVGDISKSGGSVNTPDGIINIWDLLYLLNKYGTNDGTADLGRSGSSVTAPPNKPFSHNLNTKGPDGIVNIWDLLILLGAYGSTWDSINTPFAPINVGVEELGGDQYQITWETAFANDCQEAFYVYTLDATEGFVPTVDHASRAKVVDKEVRETTIETEKPYLAICALNNSTTSPLEKYFSKPAFITIIEKDDEPPVVETPVIALSATTVPESGGGMTVTVNVTVQDAASNLKDAAITLSWNIVGSGSRTAGSMTKTVAYSAVKSGTATAAFSVNRLGSDITLPEGTYSFSVSAVVRDVKLNAAEPKTATAGQNLTVTGGQHTITA